MKQIVKLWWISCCGMVINDRYDEWSMRKKIAIIGSMILYYDNIWFLSVCILYIGFPIEDMKTFLGKDSKFNILRIFYFTIYHLSQLKNSISWSSTCSQRHTRSRAGRNSNCVSVDKPGHSTLCRTFKHLKVKRKKL